MNQLMELYNFTILNKSLKNLLKVPQLFLVEEQQILNKIGFSVYD